MDSSDEIALQALHLIDASLNQIGEGLNYLKNNTRRLLNEITNRQWSNILEHILVLKDWYLQQKRIDSGNASGNPGLRLMAPADVNAKKSIRVLEELTGTSETGIQYATDRYGQAYSDAHEIENMFLPEPAHKNRAKRICGLYVIIDMPALKDCNYFDIAGRAIDDASASIRHLAKNTAGKKVMVVARKLKKFCTEYHILFEMNDNLDSAPTINTIADSADSITIGSMFLLNSKGTVQVAGV